MTTDNTDLTDGIWIWPRRGAINEMDVLSTPGKRQKSQGTTCDKPRARSNACAQIARTVSIRNGELFAIAMEDLDIDTLQDFHYATYRSGKQWDEATGTTIIPIGDRPFDGLISFLTEFLRLSDRGAIVIANWTAKRTDPHMSPNARNRPEVRAARLCTSRLAFFDNEVHHVLTPVDTDPELIEDTIREPWHQWFTGVCAAGLTIPNNNEFSEDFLDELVARTQHIFVPAFDGEGFLVWSPN